MTLEGSQGACRQANAYYKGEQTTTGSEKAKEAKGFVEQRAGRNVSGQTISGPLFGFDVKRERTVIRLTARLQPSWKNRKPRIRYTPCLRMRRG